MSRTTLQRSSSSGSDGSQRSSSLGSDLRGERYYESFTSYNKEPLDDILDILSRKRQKSKRIRQRMDKMYERVHDAAKATERIDHLSKHIKQVDDIVDNATYMKIEKNKRLLLDKTNWQNDEDQVNVMQSLNRSQILASQLESELMMCDQPMDLNNPNVVGSKLLSGHTRDPVTNDFVPTKFLVFDKSGRCLGNVDSPICMELNSASPATKSAMPSGVINEADRSREQVASESKKESRRSSVKDTTRRRSTDKRQSAASARVSRANSSDLSDLPDSSEEDLQLVKAIERLVSRVENSAGRSRGERGSRRESEFSQSNPFDEDFSHDGRDLRRHHRPPDGEQSVRQSANSLLGPASEYHRGSSRPTRQWRERVPELGLAEYEDSTDDEGRDVEYPGVSALAMTALGKTAYGDSQWSVLEKKIRAMTHDAAMEHKISAGYVDNFTWDDEAPKMGAQNLPTISEVLTNTGIGGKTLIRASAWKTADSEPTRLSGGGGGLLRPRANKFLTTGELAYYHSQMSDEDQMNLVSVLLACRKLEKTLEDQNTVIDMLQKDLEQTRKTTFQLPDGLRADQFVNLLDLDGPICGDYFQLPECTAAFYSRLHADPTSQLSRGAASETEKKLRDAMKQSVGRHIHSPQIIHRMVEDVLTGNSGKKAVWQVGKTQTESPAPSKAEVPKTRAPVADSKTSIKASTDPKKLNLQNSAPDAGKGGAVKKPGAGAPPAADAKKGAAAPGVKPGDAAKPSAGKPGAAKPGAAKPADAAKPGAAKSDAAKGGAAKPVDAAKPGAKAEPAKVGAKVDSAKAGAKGEPAKGDPAKAGAKADPAKAGAKADPAKAGAKADPAAKKDTKAPEDAKGDTKKADSKSSPVAKKDGTDAKKSDATAKPAGAGEVKKGATKSSTEVKKAAAAPAPGDLKKADSAKADAKKSSDAKPDPAKKNDSKDAAGKDSKKAPDAGKKADGKPAEAKKDVLKTDSKDTGAKGSPDPKKAAEVKKASPKEPAKAGADAKQATTDPKKAEAKADVKKAAADPKKADAASKKDVVDAKKTDTKKAEAKGEVKKADADPTKVGTKAETKEAASKKGDADAKSATSKSSDAGAKKGGEVKKVDAKPADSKKAGTADSKKAADAKADVKKPGTDTKKADGAEVKKVGDAKTSAPADGKKASSDAKKAAPAGDAKKPATEAKKEGADSKADSKKAPKDGSSGKSEGKKAVVSKESKKAEVSKKPAGGPAPAKKVGKT